jgi:hypothetical protein
MLLIKYLYNNYGMLTKPENPLFPDLKIQVLPFERKNLNILKIISNLGFEPNSGCL